MRCNSCQKELPEDSKFCIYCGSTLEIPKPPRQKSVISVIFGILFIFMGFLPYVLGWDVGASRSLMSMYAAQFGIVELMAVTSLQSFANFLAPYLYFPASVLTVYCGLLLVKQEKHSGLMVFSMVMQLLSSLYAAAVKVVLAYFPQVAISLFRREYYSLTIDAEEIVCSQPEFVAYLQKGATMHLMVALICAVLFIVGLAAVKQNRKETGMEKMPTAGNVLMIFMLPVLTACSALATVLIAQRFGNMATAAFSAAKANFNMHAAMPYLLFVFLFLAVSVLFNKTKRWILVLPALGTVIALCALAFLTAKPSMAQLGTSQDLMMYGIRYYRSMILSSGFFLIALFFWFGSVSRDRTPKWLQIVLPLMIPFMYIVTGVLLVVGFQLTWGYSAGLILPSFLVILLSLVVRRRASALQEIPAEPSESVVAEDSL